jgi:hypothetical protein
LQVVKGPALNSCRPVALSLMSSSPLERSSNTNCSFGEASAACSPGTVEATVNVAPAWQVAGPPAAGVVPVGERQ